MDKPRDHRKALLELWYLRCRRASNQHFYSTHWYRALDSALTILNIVSSISVLYLSAVPWFIDKDSRSAQIYLSLAALATVITSVLQYVLDYRSRWRDYESSLAKYACLHRKIELHKSTCRWTNESLDEIKSEYDQISDNALTPPRIFYNRPKYLTNLIKQLEMAGIEKD